MSLSSREILHPSFQLLGKGVLQTIFSINQSVITSVSIRVFNCSISVKILYLKHNEMEVYNCVRLVNPSSKCLFKSAGFCETHKRSLCRYYNKTWWYMVPLAMVSGCYRYVESYSEISYPGCLMRN